MEHLTFDEIVNAIYTERLTPESARLIAKVNSHVMKCPECDKIHKAVYEIHELGFELGLEEVEERLKKLEMEEFNVSGTLDKVTKYITQIVLSIDNNRKILLNSIKNLSAIKYYYSYPVSLATRGGEQSVDTSKLVDDENIDNVIEFKDGILHVQFSKYDFEDNGIPCPALEVLSDGKVIYDGSLDDNENILYKNIKVDNINTISVNLKEKNV